MRRLGTRRAEIFDDLRPDDGGEQAEDRENDEEFEESKAIFAFIACVHCDTAKSLKPRIAVIIDAIIAATAPPSRTVMSGVTTAISLWMRRVTSRSSTSASRSSIMPSWEVSSPVRMKPIAMRGRAPVAASRAVSDPPSLTCAATPDTAAAIVLLPMARQDMAR